MAEALKHYYGPETVRRIAASIAAVEPRFPAAAFEAEVLDGFEELELMPRVRRIARLGAIPNPFSTYVYYHGEKMQEYGAERLNRMFAVRSFLDAGVRVTQTSDYPPGPFEPMMALQSSVTRTDSKGTVWGPKQRITVEEAIRVGTLHGAYASYEEHLKGSLEPGKLADLVIYEPAYFGIKPFLVLKGGLLVNAQMGDPNASIATPQPVYMRPQFAAYGRALSKSCISFVSQAAVDKGIACKYGLERHVVAVKGCRKIGKKHLKWNNAMPKITVDPETYEVRADGELLTCEPAKVLPLAQRYNLF